MARITKNGNLRGTVGNLVFVQNGDAQYVRSKPTKVKQSAETKKAASLFGWVSTRDKEYRRVVQEKLSLTTDSGYAARHRARMKKTLETVVPDPHSITDWSFQNPEALVGFDFNVNLPWEKVTQLYPEFNRDNPQNIECRIPALYWGQQIKPIHKSKSALLKLEAFSLDPNAEIMEITLISSWHLEVSPTRHQEPTLWSFPLVTHNPWVVVIATLSFDGGKEALSLRERTATCYLWAKNIQAS